MAEALPTTTQASALSCLGQSGSGGGSPGREEGSEKQIGSPRCLLLSLLRSEALVTNKNGGGGPQGGRWVEESQRQEKEVVKQSTIIPGCDPWQFSHSQGHTG